MGGGQQTLFLDFNGESIDTSIFGSAGTANLSPLNNFLTNWGLNSTDENAVIDAIIASVEESLAADIRGFGGNGDFDASGIGGEFDIEILNSRDHTDPFGSSNVSRIIVGGSTTEFGIFTIGIAESIDVGNFDTTETGVVLLDLLSAVATDPNSLNQFTLDPSVSIIDIIGVGVGNIVAHEAGHLFGNFHTDQFNVNQNIMDQGGSLPNTVGLVGGVWGDGNESDVDFGDDVFVANEGFTGTEDTLNTISFGLPTRKAPRITDVIISGSESNHEDYSFDQADAVGSGAQIGTVPVGGADRISVRFNKPVNGSIDALVLHGFHTGETYVATDFSGSGTSLLEWTFAQPFVADKMNLELLDTLIVDQGGKMLDGEWFSPAAVVWSGEATSTFPSGNGAEGGNFNFFFTILPGDFNGDNVVDIIDLDIWIEFRKNENFWQTNLNWLFSTLMGDADGDGDADMEDLYIWYANYLEGLDFTSWS